MTTDEVFMIFYSLDKDGDGYLDREEVKMCFMPREYEYAFILN